MKVGILGSGQLSKMLFLAGSTLGIEFVTYSDVETHFFKDFKQQIIGTYTDIAKLNLFLSLTDIITFENENIPKETLEHLATSKKVYPCLKALEVSQDRLIEKNFLSSLNIPTTKFYEVNTKSDLIKTAQEINHNGILKKRRLGYDGKGQFRIKQAEDLVAITEEDYKDCILEEVIPFDREISIIAVRSINGAISYYDLCQNHHEDGILRKTINVVNDPYHKKACDLISKILIDLDYVGICTLELFQVGDTLIANEIAPRVHNSGHWTIEGATTSQFENHIRAITSLPLGSTNSVGNFEMHNLISEIGDKAALLKNPNLHLHDYQKEPRKNRKLGHTTIRR